MRRPLDEDIEEPQNGPFLQLENEFQITSWKFRNEVKLGIATLGSIPLPLAALCYCPLQTMKGVNESAMHALIT